MQDNKDTVSSEVWNTGGAYSFNKIFKNLDLFDCYLEVAKYGAEDINMAMTMSDLFKNKAKIEAINRMVITLRKIFDNASFKIRKSDKEKFDKLEKDLDEVEKVVGAVSKTTYDQLKNAQSIELNLEHFNLCFESLRKIARELNVYINNAGFIFRTNEDLTKESVFDRFVNQG